MRTLTQLLVSALSALAMLCIAAGPSLSTPCASSCACDDEVDAGDSHSHADGDECGDEHDEEQDDCPDDCPGCACGGGASAPSTVVALSRGPIGESLTPAVLLTEARARGVSSAVFRPPRS